MSKTTTTARRARAWRWMRRHEARHGGTLAQVTGAALAAGIITADERAALLRAGGAS